MCNEDKTSDSVQACSDLAHVVLVLVSVRRVTVVHIGLEGVVVVIHCCVSIFVRELLYREIFSLHAERTGICDWLPELRPDGTLNKWRSRPFSLELTEGEASRLS